MILDGIVAGLLLITIVYCWRLSKKITALNNSRKELRGIISEFDKAIYRADTSITNLKKLSVEADNQLQKHIEKARFLTNDLAFLTHKGDNIADRLEGYISKSRPANPPAPAREIKFTGRTRLQSTPAHSTASTLGKRREEKTEQKDRPPTDEIKQENLHNELGWKNVKDIPFSARRPAAPIKQPRNDTATDSNNKNKPQQSESKKKALEEVLQQIAARKKEFSGNIENKNTSASAVKENREN